MSASTSDFPMGRPCDFRNVYAIPPPISIASATFIRFSTTSILSETFRAAQHSYERPLGIRQRLAQIRQLAFHQQSGCGLFHEARNSHDRGVRAVRRAERIAHKQPVAQRRQLAGETLVVGLFLGVVAHVLEQQHAAIGERAAPGLGVRAHAIRCKLHRRAQQLRELCRHRPQAVFRIGLALRPSQMRRQHKPRAARTREFERRQRFPYARIVGDAPAVQRNIEIHANKYALAAKFQVTN